MPCGPTSSCIWGYSLCSIPNQRDASRAFLLLGNPWECKSRRYDHGHLVPRSLRDLWDKSESHFLPGLHISWLVIPQTSPGRTAQDIHGWQRCECGLSLKPRLLLLSPFCSPKPMNQHPWWEGRVGFMPPETGSAALASAVPPPSAPAAEGGEGSLRGYHTVLKGSPCVRTPHLDP